MKKFLLACCLTVAALPARAVVIPNGNGSGNTIGTGVDGWDYTGSIFFAGGAFNASGVYLGEYGGTHWVLTAFHISGTAPGPTFGAGLGTFNLGGFSYSFTGSLGQRIAGADIYVVPITSGSAAAESYLESLPTLSIAASTPTLGTDVTMIGSGITRATGTTTWYVDTGTTPNVWNTTSFPEADITHTGFTWGSGNTKRWGTNDVGGYQTTNVGFGVTSLILTDFDNTPNEAQAALGDSGGGVFIDVSGTTTLSGIMLYTGGYPNQPASTTMFGNVTGYADISVYRSAILAAIVPEPSTFILLALGAAMLLWATRRGREGERSFRCATAGFRPYRPPARLPQPTHSPPRSRFRGR